MLKYFIKISVLFLFFLAPSFGKAEEEPPLPKLTVFTYESPFIFEDEKGQLTGEYTEKVRAFLNSKGLAYEFVVVPFTRGFRDVQRNDHSLIFSLYRSLEREDQFHWLYKLSTGSGNYLVTRNDASLINLSHDEIISGDYMAICESTSWHCGALVEYGFSQQNILTVSGVDTEGMLNLIFRSRADFYIEDLITVSKDVEKLGKGMSDIKIIVKISENNGYLAAPKNLDSRFFKILGPSEK